MASRRAMTNRRAALVIVRQHRPVAAHPFTSGSAGIAYRQPRLPPDHWYAGRGQVNRNTHATRRPQVRLMFMSRVPSRLCIGLPARRLQPRSALHRREDDDPSSGVRPVTMEFDHRSAHVPSHHRGLGSVGGRFRKGWSFDDRRPTESTVQGIQDAGVPLGLEVQLQALHSVFHEHRRCINGNAGEGTLAGGAAHRCRRIDIDADECTEPRRVQGLTQVMLVANTELHALEIGPHGPGERRHKQGHTHPHPCRPMHPRSSSHAKPRCA